MAISVFPAPVTSSINASAITAASANTMYAASLALEPSIYTITCASGTITNVEFYSGVATLVTTATTSSGNVTINLGSSVDRVRLWTNTGSNVVVTITKTANALINNFSGTLDTITTIGSSTYTGTSTSGYAYAVLVGGGGGASGHSGASNTGCGGGGGGVTGKFVTLTGSMPVVIGAGGAGGTSSTAGTNGGNSTFAGMTSGGGGGGLYASNTVAAAGTSSGGTSSSAIATGGHPNGTAAVANVQILPFVKSGTNGGGGGLSGGGSNPGAGSGIGTGGSSGFPSGTPGGNATGYGSGGGGGFNSAGGSGSQGVLYVLKF